MQPVVQHGNLYPSLSLVFRTTTQEVVKDTLKKEEETPFMYLHLILGSTSNNYICSFFTGKKNRQSSARPGWPCPSPTSLNNAYAASLFRFRSLRLRGHPPVLYKSPSPSTGRSHAMDIQGQRTWPAGRHIQGILVAMPCEKRESIYAGPTHKRYGRQYASDGTQAPC